MNHELLKRYISGEASDAEKIRIAEWLDEAPENMREFVALRKLYDITLWNKKNEGAKTVLRKKSKTVSLTGNFLTEFTKIAAIFVLAFLAVRYLFPTNPVNEPVVMQTIHVPAGQRAVLTLVDGTKVWLNAKTTFTFPNRFSADSRNVTLDGEGYFDVTGNKKQPFKVKTEKYDIKVWGTEFNVMAYSGKDIFETSLLEGSVELLKSGAEKGAMIRPNERIFLKDNQLVRAPIVHYNHFLWKEGLISFNNESFPEMVSKLELYFDLKIIIKNNKILNYRCTGKFRTKDGVEHILKVLQLSNKFRFTIDDKLNIITIE
jgi:ferric-dicitrate binding protein FerR (iron transport regulator)